MIPLPDRFAERSVPAPLPGRCWGSVVASAATGAGTAAGAAAASAHVGQGNLGRDKKAHGTGVDFGSADRGPQFLRGTEGVAVLLGDEIPFVGFVESQADAGAAASAGGEIQTNGRFFLVSEEGVKFGASAFGESKHWDAPLGKGGLYGEPCSPKPRSGRLSVTAAGAAAGSAAAPALKRNFRFDDEAHVAYVDFYAADAFKQRFFQAEREPVDFKGLVIVGRLIQSQGETGAASAAGGQVNADAGLGLVGEERLKFLTGTIGKIDHRTLQKSGFG